MFTMKIQLLKRTVKLRIDRHIIVITRERDNMHNSTPTGFRGAFKVKRFASFQLENMKLNFKKINANCSHIINNGFL